MPGHPGLERLEHELGLVSAVSRRSRTSGRDGDGRLELSDTRIRASHRRDSLDNRELERQVEMRGAVRERLAVPSFERGLMIRGEATVGKPSFVEPVNCSHLEIDGAGDHDLGDFHRWKSDLADIAVEVRVVRDNDADVVQRHRSRGTISGSSHW